MIENNTHKRTIAIDFDGVIHKYSKGWQDGTIYDTIIDGTIEKIMILKYKMGYDIVIFTARSDIIAVRDWINIHLWNSKKPSFHIEITNTKPAAYIYIDDRCICFDNWNNTLKSIKEWDM